MAEHIIALTDKQETGAQAIVDDLNNPLMGGGNLTIDKWMKQTVVQLIKVKLDQLDAARLAAITAALPDATNNQLNQIKTILGV